MRPAGYEFAVGSYFQAGANRNAGEVGAHLDHLREHQGGELTPQAIVDDARNANSPLHSFFEWNDDAAAEQHRLHQARGLIRSVVAIYAEVEREPTKVRAFVHIPEPGQAHYRSTPDAMSAEHTRGLVLQRAWREWQTFQAKYASLKEFSALFEAAERVETKIPQPARGRHGS